MYTIFRIGLRPGRSSTESGFWDVTNDFATDYLRHIAPRTTPLLYSAFGNAPLWYRCVAPLPMPALVRRESTPVALSFPADSMATPRPLPWWRMNTGHWWSILAVAAFCATG